MKDHHDQRPGMDGEPLPADIAQLATMLDQLGHAERVSAPPSIESRVMASVRAVSAQKQQIDATEQSLAKLGAEERNSAAATFEDRIFLATRGLLLEYRAHKPETDAPVVVASFSWRRAGAWSARAAAGLALCGGVIWGYRALVGSPGQSGTKVVAEARVEEIEKAIENQMDDLTAVLALLPDTELEEGASSEGEENADWLQVYFQLETEGSL